MMLSPSSIQAAAVFKKHRFFLVYGKMAILLDFYEVMTTPVFSYGVAFLSFFIPGLFIEYIKC